MSKHLKALASERYYASCHAILSDIALTEGALSNDATPPRRRVRANIWITAIFKENDLKRAGKPA